jgi:hypothetical protein
MSATDNLPEYAGWEVILVQQAFWVMGQVAEPAALFSDRHVCTC